MYALLLVVVTVVCCIMMAPGLQADLQKVPFCKQDTASTFYDAATGQMKFNCEGVVGYLAVYRVCFILTLFFVLMALIMIGVKTSNDFRAGIQNGFWGLKFLIVAGGVVGAFFIPQGHFGQTWMYFGLVGGFLFIMIQLILIVDFAHSWAESWVEKFEETDSKAWYAGLLSFTFLHYVLALVGVVLFYIYYTTVSELILPSLVIGQSTKLQKS
jgi:hypothetical protein